MPRIGGGGGNSGRRTVAGSSFGGGSSSSSVVGSNSETLPMTNNVDISTPLANVTKKKLPVRAASCITPRSGLSSAFLGDASPTLPNRAPESMSNNNGNDWGDLNSKHQKAMGNNKKRSSFRAAERGRGDVLPSQVAASDTTDNGCSSSPRQRRGGGSGNNSNSRSFKASERGRGELLPTRSSDDIFSPLQSIRSNGNGGIGSGVSSLMFNRARSSSSSNVANVFGGRYTSRRNTTSGEQLSAMTQSLRNRRSTVHLDDPELSVPIVEDTTTTARSSSVGTRERGVKYTWSDTFGKQGGKAMRRTCSAEGLIHGGKVALLNHSLGRGHLLQAFVMLAVTFFVYDSYHRAMTAAEQLLMVKHDESIMMLHLKKLEEQSLHLHESISRLTEGANSNNRSKNNNKGGGGGGNSNSDSVDEDLIKVQYGQLKQMEDELTHEVKALQTKIQATDRSNIVHEYGEGPVQVSLEIDFPGMMHAGSSHISVLLWYETPHAAWTLLHQVKRGLWDGAPFALDKNLAVVASQGEPDKEKRLDFVEKGQKRHESWTVGLSESDSGALSLFINLQDNTSYHSHEVCIGKVIDGFDTLQRLTRAARDQTPDMPVRIKKATGSHLTRRDSSGLI